jgi:hypothetical protein
MCVRRLINGARLVAIVALAASVVSACASASRAPTRPAASATESASSSTGSAQPIAVTHFGALTLRHPATWHAYLTPDDGDLPNGDGAYLTDQPISARCTQTPAASATLVRCRDDVGFPLGPGPRHVWIEVEIEYAPLDHHGRNDLDIDGYHAELDASVSDALGFPVDSTGFPVPFCSAHTNNAVQITARAPSTAIQPSIVVITACFGTETSLAQREVRTMLQTASITTRPSQTAPVAGAARCTRDQLRMSYNAQGASQSIVATYTFTNVGKATCRLRGYPRLVLLISDGSTADNVHNRRQGHRVELFVRPGQSVNASTQAFLNYDLPVRTYTTIEQVYLPGVQEPFTQRLDHRGLPIFDSGLTVDVSPLQGD